MELILTITYAALFLLIIYKSAFFSVDGISKKYFLGAFLLKVLFGFIIWGIYTYYYTDRATSDIFKYYDDASRLYYNVFKNSPIDFFRIILGLGADDPNLKIYFDKLHFWEKPIDYGIFNDNRTVIRFNAIIFLFSFGYYHIHTLAMCFVSFAGLTAILKTFYPLLKNKTRELFFAAYLIPSVLFWGSGVLKEGLLLFGVGFMVYEVTNILKNGISLKRLFWIFASIGILLITKVYVFLVAIPGLVSLVVIHFSGNSKVFLKFLITHIVIISLGLSYKLINRHYDILLMLSDKQKDFFDVARDTKAGSLIHLDKLEPHIHSFINNSPEGIINGLFRPHILDSKSPMILFAAFENLFFIALLLLAIFFFKKPDKENLPLVFFSTFFVLLLALMIGLVVPVLGAIVRYKVPLLPFLYIVLILLIDKEKLIGKFTFLKFLR